MSADQAKPNLFKATFGGFIDDNCPRMAAALAFFAILALAPMLVLAIKVAGLLVNPEDLHADVADQLRAIVGADGAQQITMMLEAVRHRGHTALGNVLSIFVMTYGATGMVVQLQESLNAVWQVGPDPERGVIKSFFLKRALSLAMVLGIALLLLILMVLATVAEVFGSKITQWLPILAPYVPPLVTSFVSFVLALLVFAAIFKILPDAQVAWRDVWVGAAATAALFVAGKFLIGLYLGHQSLGSLYGAAASLVLILLWIYYLSIILLLGAEFTQAWAGRAGKPIEPSPGAVRVIRRQERRNKV